LVSFEAAEYSFQLLNSFVVSHLLSYKLKVRRYE
jgi:hypothetical protein